MSNLAVVYLKLFWEESPWGIASVPQRSPNPPEFAQPHLSRSNGGRPLREGANLGVFVPIWLVLHRCEARNLGVFDLCHFALLKRGCANSDGFGARWCTI